MQQSKLVVVQVPSGKVLARKPPAERSAVTQIMNETLGTLTEGSVMSGAWIKLVVWAVVAVCSKVSRGLLDQEGKR